MPVFEYEGLDNKGKKVSGLYEAESSKAARQKLRKQGVFTTKIALGKAGALRSGGGAKNKGGSSVEIDFSKYFEFIGVGDIAIATRQLASLLGAGIPLVESLGALADQVEKESFRLILREVRTKVNEGSNLADALGDYPKVFSGLYVNMVRAGEQAGALEHVLGRLADFTEAQVELQGKVGAALTYPAVMFFVALGVIGFLLAYVVPKITKVFRDMGNELPFITKVVLFMSDTLQDYWWLLIAMGVAGVFGFRRYYRTEAGRKKVDGSILKIPVLGRMLLMISVSRFASTLATLMASGVPLLKGMRIVRELMDNVVLKEAVETAEEAVREGQPMNKPLKESGHFPPMVTHMIAVGERTGDLGPMLQRISDTYEGQVSRRVETLTSLLEPLMILTMGGIVFVIALAVLMPMLQMNQMAGG
jgi:general secretion pathway protein F